MIYDKLVRDKIPEIIEREGKKAHFRVLDKSEYKEYLEKKLDEEVAEFHESKSVEELADVVEVLLALIYEYGYGVCDVYEKRCIKTKENGAFEKKICLVEVEEDD